MADMKGERQENLKITKNLIRLERGSDELLLINSFHLQPLYIKSGREYVKEFVDSIPKIGTAEGVKKAFPGDPDLLDMLMKHKIAIPESEPEAQSPETISTMKKGRDNRKGMSLYLLLSQSCNLGCVYCLNGIKTYKKEQKLKMTREVACGSIDRCISLLNQNGSLQVVFFGGEPLLNWPLAKEVVQYCEKEIKPNHPDKNIHYHITSNLTHLPDDLIEWAKEYTITFLCDLDGPGYLHNQLRPYKNGTPSYSDITANIARLNGAGLRVALRTTVTAINQDHMLETARHHKELGAVSSAFVPVNPVNSDEDILGEMLLPSPEKVIRGIVEVYESKTWKPESLFPFSTYSGKVKPGARLSLGCGAPYGNTPVVDVNGDVYPCIYLVGLKRFYMGNIMGDNYPDNRLLDWMMDFLHVDNSKECKECTWRYLCGGGCPVGRLTVLDNPRASASVAEYTRKIRCDYTKAVLETLLWEMAEEAVSVRDAAEGDSAVALDNTIYC